MDNEKTKNSKDKTAGTDFSCNPQDFKGMFEMIGKCFSDQDEMPDCSAMMKTMMANCGQSRTKYKKS